MAGSKSSSKNKRSTENYNAQALVPVGDSRELLNFVAPIVSSYNDRIRPLIDVVDKLRHLNIMKEGIQLPTIVVVGDQSSGKSSVLESLAGISLPRGQGICTRVPLIMRLQHHSEPQTMLSLEYKGKTVRTDESHVAEAINIATDELAGQGKGISNTPLTLEVRKKGVPDLTMVDLPGITRVPVHGQPENIYDQIKEIIMEYLRPEQSIILNVLSATVDFTTCESIRMSQVVDKTGERTLAVVTKADRAPEGLMEKVTNDDVNIGLGYVCVRNRIGDESYEEARNEETHLFDNHHLLSKIDKSIVGIPTLAQKLVQIQASSIAKNLPNFLPRTAFLVILQRKVKAVSYLPIGFVEIVWNYLEDIVTSVLGKHSSNYYQLQLSTKRAGHVLIAKMKRKSIERVMEFVEMEKLTDYTCNPEYLAEWNRLISQQESFTKHVAENPDLKISIEGFGEVEVGGLQQYQQLLPQAFDLRMRMTAYWKIVLKRLVDCMALHLEYSIDNLINKELESEIVNELLGPGGVGIEKMLEESPNLAVKREKLNRSIGRLRDSKEVVANILDRIATFGG